MNLNLNSVLKNQSLLYGVLFIALVNVLNYLRERNYKAILVFLVFVLLGNCINKNMIIVLGASLVLTHILTSRNYGFGSGSLLEGLKDKDEDKDEDEDKVVSTIK
jgi:hypothetical protein